MLIGIIICLSSHINSRQSSVFPAPKRKVHPQRTRYPAEDPRLTTVTVPTACQLTARHFPSRLFLLQWKVYGQLNLTPHMKFRRPQTLTGIWHERTFFLASPIQEVIENSRHIGKGEVVHDPEARVLSEPFACLWNASNGTHCLAHVPITTAPFKLYGCVAVNLSSTWMECLHYWRKHYWRKSFIF